MSQRVFTQTFGVAAGILEKDGRFLLVKENTKFHDRGKFNHPAGWIDVGEDPLSAVIREVKEETGLDFEPTALLGIYSLARQDLQHWMPDYPHAIKLLYKGRFSGEQLTASEEIAELRWFTPEEIDAMDSSVLRDVDIKQAVHDYQTGIEFPLSAVRHTVQK